MADIAHTLPAIVTANDGSTFGFERPGLQITPFDAGPMRSRDWLGYNLRTYDLDPSLWQSGTTALQQWSAFWHHIGGGSEVGYIVEPVSETHRDLVCGGIADGAKTTFPIPVKTPTSVTVFVDGVPQESGAYTLHTVANLSTDAKASAEDSSDFSAENATVATAAGISVNGLGSIKTTPAGGANPRVYGTATITSGVTAAEEYTAVAVVLATAASAQNYRIQVLWSQSGGAFISTSSGSDVSVSAGAWIVIAETFTAPALAARASVRLQRNDTSGTDPYYADCFALNPGDYTRWHLPSRSPGLVEFASAPAAGARITATATGQRVTRCRFEPGSSWSVSSAGHTSSRSIRAVEDIEV